MFQDISKSTEILIQRRAKKIKINRYWKCLSGDIWKITEMVRIYSLLMQTRLPKVFFSMLSLLSLINFTTIAMGPLYLVRTFPKRRMKA
jgi:hypothetical protein